jgi:dephospho-CoA kinase
MKNIAIVGKMYAGKTTLAHSLMEEAGYTRVAMAGPLKKLAEIAYGEVVEKDHNYPTIELETGGLIYKSGRRILQEIGQSLKQVDRNIWLKCFINDTNNMDRQPYVVDDVRFGFEADYLRAEGWLILKVDTPEKTRVDRGYKLLGRRPTQTELHHESEVEVDDIIADKVVRGTEGPDTRARTVLEILTLARN